MVERGSGEEEAGSTKLGICVPVILSLEILSLEELLSEDMSSSLKSLNEGGGVGLLFSSLPLPVVCSCSEFSVGVFSLFVCMFGRESMLLFVEDSGLLFVGVVFVEEMLSRGDCPFTLTSI